MLKAMLLAGGHRDYPGGVWRLSDEFSPARDSGTRRR